LPKGVRHLHASLQATSDTFGQKVLGIKEDDVVYSAAKLFFAYGLGNAMSFPMSVGATTLLFANRPIPDAVTDIIENRKPTIFCGVPTLFAALLAYLDQRSGNISHNLRINTSAGEALPREVGERWNALTGTDIVDGVGSTEMLHIFLSNLPDDLVYGTSGKAVPGYGVRLVDENGNDCAVGEIGELIVNGPSSAESYWNRRDKSKATFEGRWTRTGDKYEQTSHGRYIYCGRTDDMFKVSGIWLSPFEVEQAIIEHSAVLEAAVVPYRDDDDLEKPQAFVVLQSGKLETDASDIKEFVQEKIGKWKYPRKITFVPDLPKTATGKIQRFMLRD
jgi:4-hydroxybenzoate-CoA ligase